MVNWTAEQETAIYTDGTNVLVSAAAGSGKTAVLVERIIQKLLAKENPIDIDGLLVVTFTNAAAQEMRNRVGLALEMALEEDPTSIHLKKQLSLLQRASISTLHSFCMNVVRQYAYLLDIDPGFRIANDMEADLIKQDVIDELFEEWYSKEGEELEQFYGVVDRFSNDRSDVAVESLILALYDFSIQNPRPEQWLDQLAEVYDVQEDLEEKEPKWLMVIKKEVDRQFKAIEQEIKRAEDIANEVDGPYHYLETIESDKIGLQEALACIHSWDDLQSYMATSKLATLSRKRVDCDADKRKKFQVVRNKYRKRWNDLKDNLFSRQLSSHVDDMRELAPIVRLLTELVKQFKTMFTEQKREKAIVDFSDLEHYCLQLLVDDSSTDEQMNPSSVATEFKQQFSELLVDEYQDTNLVQETIITLLSDQIGAGNMFMVGDVKQSIYGFRHAEPSLFIQKYKQFSDVSHPAKRIDLARNFRSREQVLIGSNYIFRQILDEELGEIDYEPDAELIYANKMYDTMPIPTPNPELIIIDREASDETNQVSEDSEDYQELEKAQLEARVYADKIKSWIGQEDDLPLQIVDKSVQVQRDVQYRDIVILLRSMTWAPTIVDELKKQGIPVYAELSTGYFDAIEIKIMLSLLKVIDNPRQDIPLAAVLRSPIVGLDEEDLAVIRLANKGGSYYEALLRYRQLHTDETATKITYFLEKLADFRLEARQGALSELIWQIYRETGYYDFVGGMPGGRQRQANLRALYDRARGYETTSFRGLFRFLRFIERMEERGDDLGSARALSEQEDVVRIMTIHKSKGLEFPIVIMGGMDRQFNFQDLNRKYLLDKELGFATKFIDPVKRITYPTLYFNAIKQEKLREQLAEEIRVLYVALTRAKEKLVMVGNVNSFAKKQEEWQPILEHAEWVLPAQYRVEAKTYLDWVGAALIRHHENTLLQGEEDVAEFVPQDIQQDPSKWTVTVIHGSELTNLKEVDEETTDEQLERHIVNWEPLSLDDQNVTDEVKRRLTYHYAYEEASKSRAKQSVTEIKRQRELKDEYSANQLVESFQAPIVNRPSFMQKEQLISAAERGTVMHTLMQHLPLTKRLKRMDIEQYVEEFIAREIITTEESEVINIETIERFYETEIAQTMIQAETVYREVPFSLSLSAREVYASWDSDTDEKVLIQGVIDCLIPVDGGWIILDYKTDTIPDDVTEEVKERLRTRYQTQMELYRHAVETIWNQPVQATYLYFFAKQLILHVPDNKR